MIHLHVHSNFSFLDGASPPDQLLQRAAELEMPALALTDHHGLYGAVRFLQAAQLYPTKPILGAELALQPDGRHLVLLARDRQGYGNLCRLITRAHGVTGADETVGPPGPRDEPRITLDDLAAHHAGLIALSGCRRGEIPSALLAGQPDRALAAVQRYAEIFGDDFWIELEHHLLPDDSALVEALLDLAQRTGRRCVIANDVHYARPESYRLRDVMACIQTRTTLDEWTDLRHANGEYYLKSEAELRAAFALPARIFDACVAHTHEVAAAFTGARTAGDHDPIHGGTRTSGSAPLQGQDPLTPAGPLLAVSCRPPDFRVPAGETAFSHLYALCQEGVRRLYRPLTPAVSNQLAHELAIIEQMGLASFFLCVWDIVRFSREHGIRCAGRGSAADSIVAFALGITTVDPIANNLLFERFLNPGRVGMPDVDIDFDSRRRDEVIAYIQNRYSTEHAAMVANVITYRARSAFRDVAKALGFSPSLIDHLASRLSSRSIKNLREELTSPPPPQGGRLPEGRLPEGRLDVEGGGLTPLETVLQLCEQLDGYPRHLSLHNGGMLITAEPLVDAVPLEYATSGVRVCQFNKDDVELLGLIKFDILGLRTLSIVDEAVQLIRQERGLALPIDDLPLDDPAVYDIICSSKTIGIFQIESPGQWSLLARAQPRTFADLIIQIALFRPGPLQGGMVDPYIERRLGREEVSYPHPSLESCLRDTLGVVIFQEQVLQVAHDFAGLSYAAADGLRRAISHYRTEAQMDACREAFVSSALQLGRDRDLAEHIYELITYFSGYGFCRSHAAAFAKVVYQTAFLKTYYPVEFLAAILSNEPCCFYPTQTVIEEAHKWGVRTLPIDINRSQARYAVEQGAIRMGLLQVKGLSEETAGELVQARGHRPFTSLADFWRRTTLARDVAENLIAVGALDGLDARGRGDGSPSPRRKLLWQLEEVVRTVPRGLSRPAPWAREPAASRSVPELPPLTDLDAAGLDFALQGASSRYSVMSFYRRSLRQARVPTIGQLQALPAGTVTRTAGVVVSRQQPPTAKGMTFLVLADEEGELPVAAYPNVVAAYRRVIHGIGSLIVEGTIQHERYLTSLLATRFWRLNDVAELDPSPLLPAPARSPASPRLDSRPGSRLPPPPASRPTSDNGDDP